MCPNTNNRCGDCEHYESKCETCEPMREILADMDCRVPGMAVLTFTAHAVGCEQWAPSEDYQAALAEEEAYEGMKRRDAAMYTPDGKVRPWRGAA